MLQFDFDLCRNTLLDDIKTERSIRMVGGMMQFAGAIQTAINDASTRPSGEAPPPAPKVDPKKEAEEAKQAEAKEKKERAEEAALIADRKKELASLATALASKRLDLEDAERGYLASQR